MLPRLARASFRAAPALRASAPAARAVVRPGPAFTAVRFNSGPGHHPNEVETFEAFNLRYANFFNSCDDIFELQRGLNNCFAYDLVPSVEVIVAALKCARKVDDYATAVRIIEGISVKVENKGQYEAYLDELKPTLDELGITPKEGLYGEKSLRLYSKSRFWS